MGINYDEDDPWPELAQDQPAGEIEEGNAGEMMMANPIISASAKHEIQTAIIVAQKFPRNEDKIYQQFVHGSCHRLGFAMIAEYSFKRGKKKDDNGKLVDNIIKGPTVRAARELARLWRNLRYGSIPISENEDKRQILSWAWDLETNVWIQQGDLFEKVIEKQVNGKTDWVDPNEREMRELNNRRASLGIRNCILQLVPPDFMDDAIAEAKETIKLAIKDPNSTQFIDVKKRIITGFSAINVPVEELEQYIGHPLGSCDPKELEILRGIWAAIKDGHTSWSDYRKAEAESAVQGLPTEIRRPSATTKAAEPPKTMPAQQQTATAPPASPKSQPSPNSSATATPTAPTGKDKNMTRDGLRLKFE